jgi:hypothetical protein
MRLLSDNGSFSKYETEQDQELKASTIALSPIAKNENPQRLICERS